MLTFFSNYFVFYQLNRAEQLSNPINLLIEKHLTREFYSLGIDKQAFLTRKRDSIYRVYGIFS